MNNQYARWLLFGLFLVLLAGCGKRTPPLAVTLHAQDIKFDKTTINAKAGQPVELTYINEGVIDHSFAIPGMVDEQKVRPGQTVVFSFTPKKAGQFKYLCVIPGHELAGMVGVLVVEP